MGSEARCSLSCPKFTCRAQNGAQLLCGEHVGRRRPICRLSPGRGTQLSCCHLGEDPERRTLGLPWFFLPPLFPLEAGYWP